MNIAIMQPYFFPYFGYFQLVGWSDSFVLYDDVQYIKNGWVNRNKILINGEPRWFTFPVRREAHDLPINQRSFAERRQHQQKLQRMLESAYRRAPFFDAIMPLVKDCLEYPDDNIANFNIHALCRVSSHLGLKTKFIRSSDLDLDINLKGQDRVLSVCNRLGATTYANPLGGTDLYDEDIFTGREIALRFLLPNITSYRQFSANHVRNLSIIDVLMFNDAEKIASLLEEYRLLPLGEATRVTKEIIVGERDRRQPPWNVLVFPGGTELGLEINRALRDCKEINLFGAGLPGVSAAESRFANYDEVPPIYEPGAIDKLNEVVRRRAIDFIFPAHDDVVLALAEAKSRLACPLITSPVETCRIARSKSATYAALGKTVPVPATYELGEVRDFPVFVKPDRGQGSQRARLVTRRLWLEALKQVEPDLLISEFLPGEEYTVDCFSSRRQGLLFVGARRRIQTRAGISMVSVTVDEPVFIEVAQAIASTMSLYGAWFFQMKRDAKGQLKLLEFAPRVAGTMAANRVRGVNFPLLSIYEKVGVDVEIRALKNQVEISRSLENHYRLDLDYSTVYVDLDDTLVLRGQVNTRLIRLLYQCVNKGIPVHLLTRHRGHLPTTLTKYRLDRLFDQVHHLPEGANKSDYIVEDDAILIDDSFRERLSVATARGIATFDAASVEFLLDDRS